MPALGPRNSMSLGFQPCQLKKGGFRRIDITWMPEMFAENRGTIQQY